MLFGKIPLPLFILTVSYREFEPLEISLTKEEAILLAREKLLARLSEEMLISYKESAVSTKGAVTLTVIYRVIEDIAKEYPLFDLP